MLRTKPGGAKGYHTRADVERGLDRGQRARVQCAILRRLCRDRVISLGGDRAGFPIPPKALVVVDVAELAHNRGLRRRVLAAALLGVHTVRSALLVLQASDARPGALEIVAHHDVQRAAALAG